MKDLKLNVHVYGSLDIFTAFRCLSMSKTDKEELSYIVMFESPNTGRKVVCSFDNRRIDCYYEDEAQANFRQHIVEL